MEYNVFGKGLLKVNVRATNALSAADVDVDLQKVLEACHNSSDSSPHQHGNVVGRILQSSNNDTMLTLCQYVIIICSYA